MAEDNRKIAESVRNGEYFEQARGWFQAVYIGPISERSFFLLVAILSGVIAVCSALSVLRMMPLTSKIPVVVHAPEDYAGKSLKIKPLGNEGDSVNNAMLKHLVSNYVVAHEGYNSRTLISDGMIVYSNSSPDIYAAYQAAADPQNPQSYFARLGQVGQRIIEIKSVSTSGDGEGRAKVVFTSQYKGVEDNQKTRWTAKLNYTYTGVQTDIVYDEESRQEVLQATEPKFQVTKYELEQD
jgi:type IV secretory pathway component VirB8